MRVMENGIYRDATEQEIKARGVEEPKEEQKEEITITLTPEQLELLQKILGG